MSTFTTFTQRIGSVLRDNSSERYVSRKRTGKLDTRRLSRIGYSPKLFKRKEERTGKAYHVSILVDASGSMRGSRAETAIKSTLDIADALGRVGVDFELVAFNTCDYILHPFGAGKLPPGAREKIGKDYRAIVNGYQDETTLPLGLYDKGDGVLVVESAYSSRGYACYGVTSGYNVDGKSVAEATARLTARKGGRHVLIVLSDGRPLFTEIRHLLCGDRKDRRRYDSFDLAEEVERAIRQGVAVCSVGIETGSVFDYYPKQNTRVVYSAGDELYRAIISLLRAHIRRGE